MNQHNASVMNPNKAGFAAGLILGGWHLIWALLVLAGCAQAIYDFILWAHMIHLRLTIGPFDGQAASTLIIITFVIGYAAGYSFAWIWNRIHR